jgi:rhomboid protease GluP
LNENGILGKRGFMDPNRILLWLVGIGGVLALARAVRAARSGSRGWLVVIVLVLLLTATAYVVIPSHAGYVGGAAWALFVTVPALGVRRILRLSGTQQYARARRLAVLLGILHPADGWPQQATLWRALEAGQRGDFQEAEALLRKLASSGPPALRRQATFHLHRLQGDWGALRTWIESEGSEDQLARDPVFMTSYLRALGETGDLNRLVAAFARHLPSLESPALAVVRALGYLYVFAFCGRREAILRMKEGLSGYFGRETLTFWDATAAFARGDVPGARDQLAELARHADAMIRRGVEDRLARTPVEAAKVLTPESTGMLATLESQFTLEERYAERPGFSRARPIVTWVFAGLNVAAFGAEVMAGGSENPRSLYGLGGLYSRGFSPADSWRLLATCFLHFGPIHLAMNMIGLLLLGPYLEGALGRWRYALVYLSSGILGALMVISLANQLTPDRPVFLVGASGCIMGIIGGTGAVLLRGWRRERSRPASRRLLGLGGILVVQVVYDVSTPQVSMTAHLAGFAIGFAAALLMRHWSASDVPQRAASSDE